MVLFESPDYLAVDKPSGLAVIPGRDGSSSLIEQFRASFDPKLLLVHRLDKDTSGVLLLARSREAQRHASMQFQANQVQKEYLALVAGGPIDDAGSIDAAIGPHPTRRLRMTILRHGGRPARTEWKVEQRFRRFTLLRLFPKTGKTHQLRVHLLHIGLPIVCDPIYNPASTSIALSEFKRGYRSKPGQPERPLLERLGLHAHRLRLTDRQGNSIDLTAPLPKDMRSLIAALAKYGH